MLLSVFASLYDLGCEVHQCSFDCGRVGYVECGTVVQELGRSKVCNLDDSDARDENVGGFDILKRMVQDMFWGNKDTSVYTILSVKIIQSSQNLAREISC